MKQDPAGTWALSLALAALGLSCITTQLVLLRESMAAFSGNEIVLGIVLGLWLLLMGIGSWLGRFAETMRDHLRALACLLMLLAVVPAGQVFLLRALRNIVFTRGAEVGLTETACSCAVLLLPYCLPAGFALALGSTLMSRSRGRSGIGSGYVFDSLGTIFGGALFSLVLVHLADHLRLLAVPAIVSFLAAAFLAMHAGRARLAMPSLATGVAVVLGLGFFDLDEISTRFQLPGQRLLARANSAYGRLLVGQADGQINFLENGVAIASSRDEQRVEETVHYAMAQRPQAASVLLVSGGISGTAPEILKYPISRLEYVELDPLLLELGRKFVPKNFADSRLRVINTDARLHLKTARAKYDVVIVDLPAPSTAQLNRFYTAEFMREAKGALAPRGVLSFALGSYGNFVSPELGRLLSCGRRTLQTVFANTLALPGGRVFLLGSDSALDAAIADRLENRGMHPQFVNRHYLGATLTADRLATVSEASSQPAPVNRDLAPVLYYFHLQHWLSQFSFGWCVPAVLLLVAVCTVAIRLRGNALALCASGFAGSSLEVVVLVAFQALCGSVYHQVALIVTAFMAGLALGGWCANRPGRCNFLGFSPLSLIGNKRERNPVASLAFGLAVYSLALPLLLRALASAGSTAENLLALKTVICFITGALGAVIGAQFTLAARREAGAHGLVASRLYTADFLGAFLGAILAGTLLLPLVGIVGVCLLTGALNCLAGLACLPVRSQKSL